MHLCYVIYFIIIELNPKMFYSFLKANIIFKKQIKSTKMKINIRLLAPSLFMAFMVVACTKDASLAPNSTNSIKEASLASPCGLKSSQTAQSIMVDVQGSTEYIVEGNQVWLFDEVSAAIADFGYNSCNPATSGQGNGNSCRAAAKNSAFSVRCTYWAQDGHPHWILHQDNSTGSAVVNLSTIIYGESFVLSKQFCDKGKFSFTMRNADLSSRLTNLAYTIDGGSPIPLGHTVVDGNATDNNCFLGLNYAANNGPFGNSAVYSRLLDGTVDYILHADDPTSNDAGCPAISIAKVDPIQFELQPGSHTIVISGNLKGNDGLATVAVSAVKNIHIAAQGCQ